MKLCKKCGLTKPLTEFYKHTTSSDGYRCLCKICKDNESLVWHRNHREPTRTRANERHRIYRETNPLPRYIPMWERSGFESKKAWKNDYCKNHYKERYKIDPVFWAREKCRKMVKNAFKAIGIKKSLRSAEFLGFTPDELSKHLEQFYNKPCEEQCACQGTIVTKDNSHIDHIIPLRIAETIEVARELCQLQNLRLICNACNSDKSGKLSWSDTTKARILAPVTVVTSK